MMSPPLSLAWDPAVFADAARGTHRAIMNDRQRDPRYKAEGGQDVFVDRVLFREQRGTFVDLGCNDGIHGSNTYFLAQVRGWRGVCVEADPTNFAAVEPNSGRTDAKHVAVVEHLDGSLVVFNRTEPSPPGTELRVSKRGFRHFGVEDAGPSDERGDFVVRVELAVPSTDSGEKQEFYEGMVGKI